ncbi:MAG: glycine cleavage system aminomethyltransferase GcvT, partial [Azoarcus sp.]|nr:glycine cleavage system aminomethyltransferase GcvT [Azoarcus sp.]
MSDTASSSPVLQTPLHDAHVAAGARMVDFAGWRMPVNYGSQIEEHHAVRRDAGMFDVSHMLALDLEGFDATNWLRALLANDVARLERSGVPGKALYSCMLNGKGGVIDDLIVYRLDDQHYRIVVNAGTAVSDVAWMRPHIATVKANVTLTERRDLAMIAVQGPNAREKTWAALPELKAGSEALAVFSGAQIGDFFVGRTGYTGEDGFELTLPAAKAIATWNALVEAGVRPCG